MRIPLFYIIIIWAMNVEPSFSNITILHPENGGVYESANIKIRISIDNKDGDPYSVVYQLGNEPSQPIPHLNTDWFTYMQNGYHNGFSKSVAPKDANILWKSPVIGYFHEFCSPVIVNGIVY